MPETCGLIILGNSGVGKSFLANILLDRQHFKHDFSARSVTHRTESVSCVLRDRSYIIYNIPGLIEGDEKRIALNKHEIDRAFAEQRANPVVIVYVFGHQNGRIRDEDIVAFRAIDAAYSFNPNCLITIINGLPSNRPKTYNEETREMITDLLHMKSCQIYFIDHLDGTNVRDVNVRTQLIDAISTVRRAVHTKANDINMVVDDVLELQAALDNIHIELANERCLYTEELAYMEQEYEAAKRISGNCSTILIYGFFEIEMQQLPGFILLEFIGIF